MDIQHQEELRRDLLDAWREGDGDPGKTELQLKMLYHRIRQDEAVALFHLAAVTSLTAGKMLVPTAHLILHDCYFRGWGVKSELALALHHLQEAIDHGSEIALWFFGSYLLGNGGLTSVLPVDTERALEIFRALARRAVDITAMSLARTSFGSYAVSNFRLADVPVEDQEIIEWYSSDRARIRSADYLALALFYASSADGMNYAGPQYRKSREFLVAGSNSRDVEVRNACNLQMETWGIRPVIAPDPTPRQKAAETVKTVGMLSGVAVTLIIWSVIGLGLLSVAAMINAVMVPFILVLLILGFIFSRVSR